MPIASPLAPKSVLRHRPLGSHGTTKEAPKVTRASRPPQQTITKKGPPQINVASLGIGMVVALSAMLLGQFALGWLSTTWDDLHYGRPRTSQTDAFVGHETGHTPSHFIILNLHGRIEIFELPGGDPTRTKIYLGPQISGPGADLVPVTVRFSDPQRTHHPDMLICFQNTQVVFRNAHGTFQPGEP